MYGYTRSASRIPSMCCTRLQKGRTSVCCVLFLHGRRVRQAVTLSSAAGRDHSFARSTGTCNSQRLTSHGLAKLSKLSPTFWWRVSPPLCTTFRHSGVSSSAVMHLKEVIHELGKLAPTALAESWDNVGLLVEPTPPYHVRTMFLTNDLTEQVLTEAVDKNANMIVSYHPPIFVPLKRLTMASTKERIIVKAIEKRIAIYSPHTCCDAVAGGVHDWLAEGLGPCKVEPLKMSTIAPEHGWTHRLEYLEMAPYTVPLPLNLAGSVSAVTKIQTTNGVLCTVNCNEQGLVSMMRAMEGLPEIRKTVQITKLEQLPVQGSGAGRMCKLEHPVSIATVVQRVKGHLGLSHVQLALGSRKSQESEVQTVAIMAGSGASVLSGVPADVYLTGEMSHHEILAAVARGTSVIACNHSNTERGYLHVLKSKLERAFNGRMEIVVSEVDADPLTVV